MSKWRRDTDERPERKDSDDERDKPSWSEIDKMRDRSRHSGNNVKPSKDRTKGAGAAYGKYKTELSKLFDSGGIAAKFGVELVDETDSGAPGMTRSLRILKQTEGPGYLELFEAHTNKFGLPGDAALLVRATASKNLKLVLDVVNCLNKLPPETKISGKAAMLERLRALVEKTGDESLSDAVRALKSRIGT